VAVVSVCLFQETQPLRQQNVGHSRFLKTGML
jgi:hypothetical protein